MKWLKKVLEKKELAQAPAPTMNRSIVIPAIVFFTEEEERTIFSGEGYIPPRLREEET